MLSTTTDAGLTKPITFPLYNIRCVADTHLVEQVLKREPGVVKVYANPASEKAYVEYEVALADPERLRGLLQQAGFGQKTERVTCTRCR